MSESDTPSIPFKIDGTEYKAIPGETVLQAALRNGVFIPHYCWHPGLGVDGNCRMCLVYSASPGPPKPDIACNSDGARGHGGRLQLVEPRSRRTARGSSSSSSINHPLDCPICDQAGECDLQQYSFDHGQRVLPKFVETKVQKPPQGPGPAQIRFNGNRCIVCTRCVRFTEKVTGTGELAVVNRGDSNVIDTFPGEPLDNPMSGCVTDLCPVGALLDTDSIHSTRTWLLRGTDSVCGGCATGCNVVVETFDGGVKRITPRENQATNKWWMCDSGRLARHETSQGDRLLSARIGEDNANPAAAIDAAVDIVRGAKGSLGVLTSGYSTCEELFLLETLAGKSPWAWSTRPRARASPRRTGSTSTRTRTPTARASPA